MGNGRPWVRVAYKAWQSKALSDHFVLKIECTVPGPLNFFFQAIKKRYKSVWIFFLSSQLVFLSFNTNFPFYPSNKNFATNMGRKKIKIQRIADERNRQVQFVWIKRKRYWGKISCWLNVPHSYLYLSNP